MGNCNMRPEHENKPARRGNSAGGQSTPRLRRSLTFADYHPFAPEMYLEVEKQRKNLTRALGPRDSYELLAVEMMAHMIFRIGMTNAYEKHLWSLAYEEVDA